MDDSKKKKRKGSGNMLPSKCIGELTLMPEIIAASIQAWKDKQTAEDPPGQPSFLVLPELEAWPVNASMSDLERLACSIPV